jgi:hypothetical protein
MIEIMRPRMLLVAACTLAWLPLHGAQAATMQKSLSNTTGADNANPIQLKDPQTTTYELTIEYTSEGGPAVVLLDTIPAEFTNVAVDDGGECLALSVQQKGRRGIGATKIACALAPGTDASLVVTFETRPSPGRGHEQPVFAPTSCDPLVLNDGAVAVDPMAPEEDQIVAGPTAMLAVGVVGDGCDLEDDPSDPIDPTDPTEPM